MSVPGFLTYKLATVTYLTAFLRVSRKMVFVNNKVLSDVTSHHSYSPLCVPQSIRGLAHRCSRSTAQTTDITCASGSNALANPRTGKLSLQGPGHGTLQSANSQRPPKPWSTQLSCAVAALWGPAHLRAGKGPHCLG